MQRPYVIVAATALVTALVIAVIVLSIDHFSWIVDNKSWLFSGLGIAIFGIFGVVWRVVRGVNNQRASPVSEYAGRNIRERLVGTKWQGTVQEIDADGARLNTYNVTWKFRSAQGGALFCSSCSENRASSVREEYTLKSTVINDRFLVIEYQNNDPLRLNFGTEVLIVNDTLNKLSGKFVGYAPDRSVVISGTIDAQRVP